jgi:hypothetical protein
MVFFPLGYVLHGFEASMYITAGKQTGWEAMKLKSYKT